MRHSIRLVVMVLPFSIPMASLEAASEPHDTPVAATIATTLTTASGQIRQFAFDGDTDTFFASDQKPVGTDHFTLVLDKPVAVKLIRVATGRPEGQDRLDAGTLEVSADGKTYTEITKFADGDARAEPAGQQIQAIRIRPDGAQEHPLAVRELMVASDPPVAIFAYPVEFIVDVSDAPEMKEWADQVARVCERTYPMINEELKSKGYKPPHVVRMSLKSSYNGVAAAGGGRITGSVKFFKKHPDDVGAMIHETVHIVQHYRSRRNPGWLVEGVADYVRFFKFEPGKIGPIDPDRAHYNRSYRVSAAFLAYLVETYDPQIVLKLNKTMREGDYSESIFKDLTGKTVQELNDDWRATLRR